LYSLLLHFKETAGQGTPSSLEALTQEWQILSDQLPEVAYEIIGYKDIFLLITDLIRPIQPSGNWSFWEHHRQALCRFLEAEDLHFFVQSGNAEDLQHFFPKSVEGEDPCWEDTTAEMWLRPQSGDPTNGFVFGLVLPRDSVSGSRWALQGSGGGPEGFLSHRLRWLSGVAVALTTLWQDAFEQRHLRLPQTHKDRRLVAPRLTHGMIGEDPLFLKVLAEIDRAAKSEAPVFIRGESGTGKELLAKRLHDQSKRGKQPFVAINCAAIPEELIESELFGHEKGAFTGAYYRKIGKAQIAHGGTLFLDEIGEMPLSFQAKMLRFLQDGTFHRVGGNETLVSDVRLVVATHRDLIDMIAQKQFREDLYFRINVVPVTLPPLRERRGDIVLMAEAFFQKYAKDSKKPTLQVEGEVYDLLQDYDFPGNVRELENLIHRTVVMSSEGSITVADLPEHLRSFGLNKNEARSRGFHPFAPFDDLVPTSREELAQFREKISKISASYERDLERRFLLHLLEQGEGKARKAAELAEINRTLFYKMLKRSGIDVSLIKGEE
jgi:transcriptional regulator with GAF, ATPase, and Fis domain